ncbi:MAG: glycosyl hydrolase 108 family protein [Rhodomicrobium sp.]|jgi:lysozyme family protein
MASDNFERCLAITLKWEGEYSNHPDDPGGPTMRGVIQREYDAWRRKHKKSPRPVKQIDESELQEIYRVEYWDAMDCDALPTGFDLCVFDAAVNSGVDRARAWLQANPAHDIEAYCNARLEFLQRLGRLWRVFGAGWRRRVLSISAQARAMAGRVETETPSDDTLHAGMKGMGVASLQEKLRGLGYPAGAVDGIYGEQTHRAVVLFQHDNDLSGDPGIWQPEYNGVLARAEPMLQRRQDATHRDLEEAGDSPMQRMNLLQRIFAWLFGGAAAAETFGSDNVLDSLNGARTAFEPLRGIWHWATANRWLLLCALFIAVIALIRLLRQEYVQAYRNFDYQGPAHGQTSTATTEIVS